VKNQEQENFRHNNFYGQKFPAKKNLSAEKNGRKKSGPQKFPVKKFLGPKKSGSEIFNRSNFPARKNSGCEKNCPNSSNGQRGLYHRFLWRPYDSLRAKLPFGRMRSSVL